MDRSQFKKHIEFSFKVNPVVAILGPRQCGKTTLARDFVRDYPGKVSFFDLEDPETLSKLNDPKLFFEDLEGLIVLDEIQRKPELFPYIRVMSDYSTRKFLILGSASRELLQQSSESLAGRISYVELTPFNLSEVKNEKMLWHRGGFPKSYLADTEEISREWVKYYVFTFLENDIPKMGIQIDSSLMRKLWHMLAHYHGNLVNYSDLGRSLGVTDVTIKRYLDILENTFMIRLLKPWHENISKRQIKAPKVYIRDSGILHFLLGVREDVLSLHPKLGASWEGFALEEIIRFYKVDLDSCYFWKSQDGAELDLMIIDQANKRGFEIKYSKEPKITKSMRIAMDDLSLESIVVVVPGSGSYKLEENIIVSGLENIAIPKTDNTFSVDEKKSG